MTDAPTISTDRLVLRPLAMDDHAAYLGFVTSDRARHMGGPHAEGTAWLWLTNDVALWSLQGFGGLAVTRDDKMIGQVSVTQGIDFPEPELGWILLEGEEGNGYALEAASALRAWVIDKGRVCSLVSYIDPANAPSIRLAKAMAAKVDPDAARPEGADCLVYRHEVAA